LESLCKDPFSIGKIPPTPVLVNQYFNDSTGVGDEGETDARGPWNEGSDWEVVEAPELQKGVETMEDIGTAGIRSSGTAGPAAKGRREAKPRKSA